jgi:hypothetical protein
MRFTALKTFFSPEMQSEYVAGLGYTVRTPQETAARLQGRHPPEAIKAACERAEQLPSLVAKWKAEGKVREGGPEAELASIGADVNPAPAAAGDAA